MTETNDTPDLDEIELAADCAEAQMIFTVWELIDFQTDFILGFEEVLGDGAFLKAVSIREGFYKVLEAVSPLSHSEIQDLAFTRWMRRQ